jgi:hypothetical protein
MIWHGDGTPVDALGRNTLTWSSPIQVNYEAGKRGQAFDFSKADIAGPPLMTPFAAISAGSGFAVNLTELTFSLWVNSFILGSARRGSLLTLLPTQGGAETKIQMDLGQPLNGDITTTWVLLSINGVLRSSAGTQRTSANEWVHYVTTIKNDGTETQIKFYVNGLLKDQTSVPGKLPPMGTPEIQLGGGRLAAYRGKLDEVAIYGKALSDQEISALYTSVVPANCP